MSASVIAATQDIARCTITGKGYDEAHGHASEQFGHGLAYTAGVLASFAVLGGALLALRAGGQAIDWGFQLQTLVFVAVVAYLLFAMGLSLSGVVTFGAGLAGTDGRLAAWSGMTGTFFTGWWRRSSQPLHRTLHGCGNRLCAGGARPGRERSKEPVRNSSGGLQAASGFQAPGGLLEIRAGPHSFTNRAHFAKWFILRRTSDQA